MKPDDIVRYADRIYGYAVKRTFSRDEADELSQEILCAAIHSLPRLKDESRFEPWLWGIAANVSKAFRRGTGKRRAIYSYDALPELRMSPRTTMSSSTPPSAPKSLPFPPFTATSSSPTITTAFPSARYPKSFAFRPARSRIGFRKAGKN